MFPFSRFFRVFQRVTCDVTNLMIGEGDNSVSEVAHRERFFEGGLRVVPGIMADDNTPMQYYFIRVSGVTLYQKYYFVRWCQ